MDFDGDGKTDISVYREGAWTVAAREPSWFYYFASSTGQIIAVPWGSGGDRPAIADFDGDGRTDLAIFRSWEDTLKFPWEASDYWINFSSDGHTEVMYHKGWGVISNRNFVGDTRADLAVFNFRLDDADPNDPCNIYGFVIKDEKNLFQKDIMSECDDDTLSRVPALGDYNNDGYTDIAIFAKSELTERRSRFEIWHSPMTAGFTTPDMVAYLNVDFPIPGDYDGNGKTDFAGGQYADGRLVWRIRRSTDGNFSEIVFGLDGDKPVPGDYDGDGKTDVAVFRPSDATWYIFRSSDSNWWVERLGLPTDRPLTQANVF
ncbi:MAG: VCBS repeat-containing protein [Pyrinomonadaceae bacterium]|nr:VCBS repeat-containing protein [Pyrinomonadaceae bacterium]